MNKTYRINLDIGSKEPQRTNIVICAGDYGIVFDIGISGVDTTNATVKIIFKKRDGNVVEAPMTKVGTRYTYTLLGDEVSCPGVVVADVKLTELNQRVSTTKFLFEVDQDTINGTPLESGAYSTSLEEAIDRAISAAELAENLDGKIVNNLTTTAPGYALDARAGKELNDHFIQSTGTWKPTIAGLTVAGTNTYSVQTGSYVKVGKVVQITFDVQLATKDATMDGPIAVKGIPYVPNVGYINVSLHLWSGITLGAGYTYLTGELDAAGNIPFYASGENVGFYAITSAKLASNARLRGFAIFYIA